MDNLEKVSQVGRVLCSPQQTIPIFSGNTILQHTCGEIETLLQKWPISNMEIERYLSAEMHDGRRQKQLDST